MSSVQVETWGAQATLCKRPWGSMLVVQGSVDQLALGQAIRRVARLALGHRHLAGICDYRHAKLLMSFGQLAACARRCAPVSIDWPTAMVVRAEDLEVWEKYAEFQGLRGNLRSTFTAYEPAMAWTIEQAGLRLAQLRDRGAL